MSKFEIGKCYSRAEINEKLHGGGLQNSLIHKNELILAGCFKLELNPKAPETVLIRSGEMRDAYQDLLEKNQFRSFPLFIKNLREDSDNKSSWEYKGEFKSSNIMTEARDIISYLKKENMSDEAGDIVAVVTFQEAFVEKSILRKAS